MSQPRRRHRVIRPADAAHLARAEELRGEIERRLSRIRDSFPDAGAAVHAYGVGDETQVPPGQ